MLVGQHFLVDANYLLLGKIYKDICVIIIMYFVV